MCLAMTPPTHLDTSFSKAVDFSFVLIWRSNYKFQHFICFSCRLRNEKWRKQCVFGMACMIIGLEMGDLVSSNENLAMAKEMQLVVESKEHMGPRWSEKRMCPPWHQNSLETIVPENLPRPLARRRWEAVGYAQSAPAIKVIIKSTSNSCFSM